MNEDVSVNQVLALLFGGFLFILASILIPVYGYHRKRLKGLALGCLLQPVACAIAITLIAMIISYIDDYRTDQEHQAAMVTIKTTEAGACGTDSLTWYLKPDEECLVEYKLLIKDKYETPDSIQEAEKTDRFDVIRLDSLTNAVCVDDRLIVRFDLKNQRVTATDYDEPAEVVGVDWEKVKAYFP
jgi:hypothetical protein